MRRRTEFPCLESILDFGTKGVVSKCGGDISTDFCVPLFASLPYNRSLIAIRTIQNT